MYKLEKKPKTGFTLVEILVVISLEVLISITTVSIVVSGLQHIQSTKNLAYLHSNAIFLSNTLSYWVKQGEYLDTPSSSTLEISLPDSSEKIITKDGNDITIDGSIFNAENIEVIELNFDKLANSVRVEFTLKINEAEETFSTTIAQRNSL